MRKQGGGACQQAVPSPGEPVAMNAGSASTQPLAGNRCAILEAQEAPRGAGTQPLAGNATLAVTRRDRLLAV